jgi:DNA polymerase-1
MASPPKLVLVDGSAMIFRAFFAIPANLQTKTGLHTNAIYGFATMFRKLFAASVRRPDFGAVVFDAPGGTFRDEKYADYKGQRPKMADDLAEQLPWIDRVVRANRFPLLRAPGYEADDVIGTLTELAVAAGMEVVIVSADKDFAQLVGDQVRMLDTIRDVTYDAELVKKKWGVPPSQIIDLLALMGDTSDNIPGVAGIGQKGAAQLLEKYGSLDELLAHVGELKGRQKTALEEHRALALLSRELATIETKVPMSIIGVETLADLAVPEPDVTELNALYKELEFYSLLGAEVRVAEAAADAAGRSVRIADSLADAEEVLTQLFGGGAPVAVVPLFDPPSPVVGKLAGLAFSTGAGSAYYLPIDGGLGDPALALTRPWLERRDIPKIVHSVRALWVLLARRGITLDGVVGDTELASFLVEPTKTIPHRLDQVVKEYLQRTVRPLKSLTGSGQAEVAPSTLAITDAGDYLGHLADAVADAWPILRDRVEALGLTAHLQEHELPLGLILGEMELHGIRVDGTALAKVGEELKAMLADIERTIYGHAGREFNIGSTKQLAEVLFEELKLPVLKKTKTGYSTDAEVLERLAEKHAIAERIVAHRTIAKLINTYTDVLQAAIQPTTGRVHATFQQTTSATGRLITTDPDLQRTPVKTPEGKRIRQAFVPDPGCLLVSADWSQIELRVLAHVSGDPNLIEAFQSGRDVHRRTASELFSVPPEAVTPEQRNAGKTINFATIYGQGATALGKILGIPRKEAEAYIEGYFRAYAGVRAWLDHTIEEAHRTGYVSTLLGRRRYVPELSSNNPMDRTAGERIAANTPIQGSAADLCKLAMLQITARLRAEGLKTRLLLQIHDELVLEAPEPEVEAVKVLVKEIMEHVHPLAVPLVAEVGVGTSWAEAH